MRVYPGVFESECLCACLCQGHTVSDGEEGYGDDGEDMDTDHEADHTDHQLDDDEVSHIARPAYKGFNLAI